MTSPAYSYSCLKECPAGEFAVFGLGSCYDACPVGSYISGDQACTSCPENSSTSSTGSISVAQCNVCDASFYLDGSSCVGCPVNSHNTETSGLTSVEQCNSACSAADIKYTMAGSETCLLDTCPAGSFLLNADYNLCIPCGEGKFSTTTSNPTSCTSCDEGKYLIDEATEVTFHDEETDCIGCTAGRYSTTPAAVTASTCQICGIGTYSQTAAPSCTSCERGKYNENNEQTSCINCGAGMFLDSTGSFSQYDCASCAVGTYASSPGTPTCSDCSPGHYASGAGTVECNDCPPGKATPSTGQTVCTDCAIGRYQLTSGGSGTCTECAQGFYADQVATLFAFPALAESTRTELEPLALTAMKESTATREPTSATHAITRRASLRLEKEISSASTAVQASRRSRRFTTAWRVRLGHSRSEELMSAQPAWLRRERCREM